MFVIRPAQLDDLEQLLELAQQATYGLTTLPDDADLLRGRIEQSLQGFEKKHPEPAGEPYLFVLADCGTGQVVGTTGVVSKVGGFEPFYAYQIEPSIHESETLGVRKEIDTLHLFTDHDGPTEIGSLFLAPEFRGGGNGRLLSLSRFLFMAQFPDYFSDTVIAEMRGVIDENGRSPFWDAIGKHFFDIDLPTADYLSVINKRFIADLMPTHPIYIPLLPKAAQSVIGQVHTNTEPALKLLMYEGFEKTTLVDIFEAGPVVSCKLESIRAIRQCQVGQVSSICKDGDLDQNNFIASNTSRDFRACIAAVSGDHGQGVNGVVIEQSTANALELGVNDTIRYVTTRASNQSSESK